MRESRIHGEGPEGEGRETVQRYPANAQSCPWGMHRGAGEMDISRLGGLWPTKKRGIEDKNLANSEAARFVLYSDRVRLPVARVPRKSSNARRAIIPRFAL